MIVISDACTTNIINECNYTSRIAIEDPRVTLQIVASLTDDTRSIIYDCNMFIAQATVLYNCGCHFCQWQHFVTVNTT